MNMKIQVALESLVRIFGGVMLPTINGTKARADSLARLLEEEIFHSTTWILDGGAPSTDEGFAGKRRIFIRIFSTIAMATLRTQLAPSEGFSADTRRSWSQTRAPCPHPAQGPKCARSRSLSSKPWPLPFGFYVGAQSPPRRFVTRRRGLWSSTRENPASESQMVSNLCASLTWR